MQPTKMGDDLIKGGSDDALVGGGNEMSNRGTAQDGKRGAGRGVGDKPGNLDIDDSVIKRVEDDSEDDEEEEEDAESLKKMFNVEAEDLH